MTLSQMDQNVMFPLTDFSLIEINGPDSEKFLQGQLTCDIHQVKSKTWVLGACCTAKGRMIANFMLASINDSFYLRVASCVADGLINHLKKYAVFFKTSLQISDHKIYGQLTTDRPSQAELITNIPAYTNSLKRHTGAIEVDVEQDIFAFDWPDNRQEYWLHPSATPEPTAVSKKLIEAWQQADIMAGLYWITNEQTDKWIPQQIAWDQLGGVSFNKGCYTGQEIIARLQYLGKSKKVMALVVNNAASESLTEEQLITSINDDNGRSIATILRWSASLGLVISSCHEMTQVTLLSQHGQPFTGSLIPFVAPATLEDSNN